MGPLAQADGHDDPGFVDESVPGLAAGLDDGVVGGKTQLERLFWTRYCQTFSTGLSSGDRAGR